MGSRGPLPSKNPQGHREARELVLVEGGKLSPPKPPSGLLKQTRDAWDAYWRSDVSGVATEADLSVIGRLFVWRDQWERAMRQVAKEPLTQGSQGQLVESPFMKIAAKAEAAITRLETELGLTPMARQRLGIALGEAAQSLAQLNATFAASDELPAADPRFAEVIDVGESG